MFTVPNVALTNAMACRVFRQVKLGVLVERPSEISQRSGTIKFSTPLSVRRIGHSATATYLDQDSFLSDLDNKGTLRVAIRRETETASHEASSSEGGKGTDLMENV
ncbi:hypothetical protein PHLCEN_2v7059 [Hermanssonia centrifuga]|uniref:Uncharacterized protein n=1 Tax=Hermanssonia centrifuga TaxID=98765 RepID=A0A2R6NXM2_9APHY|nr:hypothetical protein PHLCEN_2v7059 [Hermanssonia centrifuga]